MKKLVCMLVMVVLAMNLTGCGFNSIQIKDEQVKSAWGDVESLYQKRADLIANLAEVVKGYATHEKDTFVEVSKARASVGQIKVEAKDIGSAKQVEQFSAQQQSMGTALSRLMMVSEKYPDLKANANFTQLQKQLEQTEKEIDIARKKYNLAVKIFNSSVRTFPNNITNNMFLNLALKEPFKADAASKVAPKLKF